MLELIKPHLFDSPEQDEALGTGHTRHFRSASSDFELP